MLILLYFDWVGSTKELKAWEDNIKEACEKVGVTYEGLYGSFNEKWNFVSVFKSESFEMFIEMGRGVVRHHKMPHHTAEILMPQKLDNDFKPSRW